MIRVRIGNEERPWDDASPSWVAQQIERRRRDGIAVCVVVQIKTADLNMQLATPECAVGAGRGRPPNASERAVFGLWEKYGLNEAGFAPGNVVAFLTQLKQFCS